jgi:SAM-dependent methyltransferase
LSKPSRERIAVTGFFLGTESAVDRILARSYFGLSSRLWASYESSDSHHASFLAGLDGVDGVPRAVLDLGTGAGGTAAVMAQRWPDATVVGVDTSRRMIRTARQQYGRHRNLSFEVGDGLRLAVPSAGVDLVTSLNYMPYPAEMARVLRPSGQVLVASTFQSLTSDAVAAHWERHGFRLQAESTASAGSFQLYRLDG